jgi:hypothetical protein
MPWAQAGTIQFSLLLTSLGATCVAGGLLALEFYGSKHIARRAPGVLVALLIGVAVIAIVLRQAAGVALSCASLALLLLLAWPVQFEVARAQIGRFLRPKIIWAALLGVSLFASRFLATSVLSSFEREPSPSVLDLADVPVHSTEAVTDKGRPVALFHFKMHSSAEDIQQFIKGNERDRAQLIRLGEANPASNCHGWVFTSGQYGVRDSDVATILTDNEYVEVDTPAQGDLAIYTIRDQICHSGVVRISEKHAPILIESKWGPFGVYLHAIAAQPFSPTCKFYRTKRANHELALRPLQTASMAAAPSRVPAPQ